MPTTHYKEARTCECGYTTFGIANWSSHKRCKEKLNDNQLVSILKEQLATKDEQIAAKDKQIEAQAEEIKFF